MRRKYPFKMFVLGVILNFLLRFSYLWISGGILCVAGIWIRKCLIVGLSLLGADLVLSVIEQLRIRKAALNESSSEEYNQLMDCFYGAETGEGEHAPQTEPDNASDERQAILEKLVVYRTLRDSIHDGMTLDEMIDAFAEMCRISVGDPDDLLYESGTFNFTGKKLFYFSLVRQFQFLDEDEYVQLRLDVTYMPGARIFGLRNTTWGSLTDGDFFEKVRRSPVYHAVKELPVYRVQVYIGDT